MNYMSLNLLQKIIIVGDSILHSQELMELDKISKDMQELNIILNQLGLTDMN